MYAQQQQTASYPTYPVEKPPQKYQLNAPPFTAPPPADCASGDSYPQDEKVHYELYSPSAGGTAPPVTQPIPYADEKIFYEPPSQPGPSAPVYPTEKPNFQQPTQPQLYLPEKAIYAPQPHPGPSTQSYINEKAQYEVQPQIAPPPPYSHTPAPAPVPDNSIYGPPRVEGAYQTQQAPPAEPQLMVYEPKAPVKIKDEMKTGTAKRFIGDTLVGRFARMCPCYPQTSKRHLG